MSTSTLSSTRGHGTVPAQRHGTVPAQRRAPEARIRQPRPTPAPQGRVRLTRRGRVVVTLLLLGLVLAAAVLLGGTSVATGDAGTDVPTRTIVVGEGDTLWQIAGDVAGSGDVRETVHRIEKLNSLPGPALEVGQELAVPVE
jgi:LysM domain